MNHGKMTMPIELAKVGLRDAANQLKNDGFLLLLSDLDGLPDALPPPKTMEKQFAERHSNADRREGYLARRQIARAVLGVAWDVPASEVEIGEGAAGAPLLSGPRGGLHLSFAARGSRALIGFSTCPIGVDLEIAEPDMLIPRNMLRADERLLLDALPVGGRAGAFCTLWTAKEAVVKALGLGFQLPPEAIRIDGWSGGAELKLKAIEAPTASVAALPEAWHLKTWPNLVVAGLTGGLVVGAARIA